MHIQNEEDVTELVFSPDGHLLATGDKGGTVRLTDTTKRQQTASIDKSNSSVNGLTFSADGRILRVAYTNAASFFEVSSRREVGNSKFNAMPHATKAVFSSSGALLATADSSGRVQLTNAFSGDVLSHMEHGRSTTDIGFATDDSSLITRSEDGNIRVFKLAEGREVARFSENTGGIVLNKVYFSPDSRFLVTTRIEPVDFVESSLLRIKEGLRDINALIERAKNTVGEVTGYESPAISNLLIIGERMARAAKEHEADLNKKAAHAAGARVRLTDLEGGREVSRLEPGRGISAVAFSPDGRQLAVGDRDGSVRVIEALTGREVHMYIGGEVLDLAFSPGGSLLASVARNKLGAVVEPETRREIIEVPLGGKPYAIKFSPDSSRVAISSDDRMVHVAEVAVGYGVAQIAHADSVFGSELVFSPDGRFLATNTLGDATRLFDASTGRQMAQIQHGERGTRTESMPVKYAFSPNSKFFSAVGKDNIVLILSTDTEQKLAEYQHNTAVRGIAFSPDSRFLAITSAVNATDRDNMGRILDVTSGRELAQFVHAGGSAPVAFSPDSRLLAAASPAGLRIIEAANGRELAHVGHGGPVNDIAFSADGRFIAAGSANNTVLVLRAERGQVGLEVARVEHEGPVWGVFFSPDNRFLVTGSWLGDSVVVRVIRPDPEHVFNLLCTRLSRSEWDTYIGPAEPWNPTTCPNWSNSDEALVSTN